MNQNYKISVIVPYFNEQRKIIKTLNALRKQTYKKFEVIMINSNSTDNSFKIVNNWIAKKKVKSNLKIITKNLLSIFL